MKNLFAILALGFIIVSCDVNPCDITFDENSANSAATRLQQTHCVNQAAIEAFQNREFGGTGALYLFDD